MNKLHNVIRSQDTSSGSHFGGVALATVTDISKMLENGIVKVKFKFREYGKTNDAVEVKIITNQKDTPPPIEVHDVVLVAFEQDSFNSGYIIGLIFPNCKDTEGV